MLEKRNTTFMSATALRPADLVDDEAYLRFCDTHDIWRVERVGGSFVMMPPGSLLDGKCMAQLSWALGSWGKAHGFQIFSSSICVRLSNGDLRMPDFAMMGREAYERLDPDGEDDRLTGGTFDVIVEVAGSVDRVSELERKCEEAWFADGHKYVLMLDPIRKGVRAWGEPPADFPSPEEILAEIQR